MVQVHMSRDLQVQVLLPAPSLKALCIKALGIFIAKGKTITTKKQTTQLKNEETKTDISLKKKFVIVV